MLQTMSGVLTCAVGVHCVIEQQDSSLSIWEQSPEGSHTLTHPHLLLPKHIEHWQSSGPVTNTSTHSAGGGWWVWPDTQEVTRVVAVRWAWHSLGEAGGAKVDDTVCIDVAGRHLIHTAAGRGEHIHLTVPISFTHPLSLFLLSLLLSLLLHLLSLPRYLP